MKNLHEGHHWTMGKVETLKENEECVYNHLLLYRKIWANSVEDDKPFFKWFLFSVQQWLLWVVTELWQKAAALCV